MAGGVAVLLLIIVLLVVGAIALALYGTGGALWLRRTDSRRDRIADMSDEGRTPHHG